MRRYLLILISILLNQSIKAQFTIYNIGNSGLTNNYCWFINESPTGKVWVGTTSNGACMFDGSNWANYNTSNSGISANYITPIAFENNDTWLGSAYTSPGGLSKFNGTSWTSYNTNNSNIPGNEMFAISIDKFSNKWIGTRFNGLSKFNGTTWTTYNMLNSNIQSNSIYSLDADTLGNVWVGAPYSGVSKFDGTTWTNYTSNNSPLPDNDIYSLKYNKTTNSMWIGTYAGVAVLNLTNNAWTIYNSTNTSNFPGDYIRGITHSSSTGKTYIATGFSGIGEFDGSNWISYNTTNSNLPSNSVWALVAGNFGKVWAATYGGGIVSMVDSNTIQTPNSCNAVFTDNFSNGSGWVFNSNNSVTISNGNLNFNNSVNGQYNNVYKSLGTTLSDNNWKAEFTFELTNLNSNSTMGAYAIALTAGNQDFMTTDANGGYVETNQDALAVIGTSNVPGDHDVNNWYFLMEDKKGNVRNWNLSTGIHMNPSILKYYLRFERVNNNITKLSVFSDSLFTTHVMGSPQTYNINPSITGLNTIQHGASTPGSPSRILNAKIDNDFICQSTPTCSANAVFQIIKDTSTALTWKAFPIYAPTTASAVWVWGDGTSSNGFSPTHTYSSPGLYNICLVVIDSCGAIDSTCINTIVSKSSNGLIYTINVISNLTPLVLNQLNNEDSKISFYPNPTNSLLNLNYHLNQFKNASLQLHDVQGKLVYQTELNTNDDKVILTLDKLDNGLYFGKVYADGILVKTEKIVKSN
jgi:hypothetical protein